MEKNYTPLNIERFNKSNDQTMTFLLLLAVITLFILAVVLFLFIQKKMKESSLIITPTPTEVQPLPTPTFAPTPTEVIFPTVLPSASPSAEVNELIPSPTPVENLQEEGATQSAR
jgi:hypothetical protein